jgi:hypothetical protein
MEIEAVDLDDALDIVLSNDYLPLPDNAEYVDGSFEVDQDILPFNYPEEFPDEV